jgi:hypothetical protein
MSYYDEDFYYEPSAFDIQVDEFKKALAESVREEFITEMERLKKENEELQSIKTNFDQIKKQYRDKEQQLEWERQDLIRKVRRERLSDLMKDFEVVMYMPYSKRELPPKCDKCDDNRKINYKTPLGRDSSEACDCSVGKYVYYPEEYICSEFRINRDGNDIIAWYKVKPSSSCDDDYASCDSSTFAETIYHDGLKYKDLKQYKTFFKTKEECQGYCDYLNAK